MKRVWGLIGFFLLSVSGWALDLDNPNLKSVPQYPELDWGATIRAWLLVREGASNGPEGLYLMQAEPQLTIDLSRQLSAVFSFNFGGQPLGFGAQNAYAHIKLAESTDFWDVPDIQFGLMHLPFGLPLDDHTAGVRTAYGLEIYRRDLVVKLSRSGTIYYDLGYTNGGRDTTVQMDGGWGGFADVGVKSSIGEWGVKVGGSALVEVPTPNVDPTIQQLYGVYYDVSYGRLRLMAELDWSTHKSIAVVTSASRSDSSIGYFAELFFDVLDNLNTSFRYDYFASNANVLGDGLRILKLSLRYRLLMYLTLEPAVSMKTNTRSDLPDPADNVYYFLATVRF